MPGKVRNANAFQGLPHEANLLGAVLTGNSELIEKYVEYIDKTAKAIFDETCGIYEGANFMKFFDALIDLHTKNPTNPHLLYLMGRFNMATNKPQDKYLPLIDDAVLYGSPEAMYFRAQRHLDPQYGTPNTEAARYLLGLAATKGHAKAKKEYKKYKIEMPPEGNDALLALDDFMRQINSQARYLKKDGKPILESVQVFHKEAVELCRRICAEIPRQPGQSQKEYNKLIGDKLVVLAKNSFPHRNNQFLSFLADLVFIPLGVLTLGKAFQIKKATTGSPTFFSFNTKRVNILAETLKQVFELAEAKEAQAQKEAGNEPSAGGRLSL